MTRTVRQPMRWAVFSIAALLCVLLFDACPATASPTGLNNISTTDVVPTDTLALQYYTFIPGDRSSEHWIAFKYGLLPNLEVGGDWKMNAEPSLHAVFQAKYRLDPNEWRPEWPELPKFVVGFANLNDDPSGTGPIAPYLATSYDVGILRLHAGYDFQHNNEAFFAGIDRTFKVLGEDFTPRADIRQINDQADWLVSAGFITTLPGPFLLEHWVSFPTSGADPIVTLKLNVVIKF